MYRPSNVPSISVAYISRVFCLLVHISYQRHTTKKKKLSSFPLELLFLPSLIEVPTIHTTFERGRLVALEFGSIGVGVARVEFRWDWFRPSSVSPGVGTAEIGFAWRRCR